jgi:TRAP-type mannitol/chloroaromatic compound transport system permease small subunit
MLPTLVGIAALISRWLFRVGFVATAVMIGAVVVEVFARYVLGEPTRWSYDITYMANGAIFMLGAAWTLAEDQHVRVDIIDARVGLSVRRILDGVFFVFAATPVLSIIAWFAASRAWRSFVTGELEMVSPWQPVIWPFQAILAVGLAALALQCLARGIAAFASMADGVNLDGRTNA